MELTQLIFDLCTAQGVSGHEEPALAVVKQALAPFAETQTDANGNLYAFLGKTDAEKTILIDAHLDRIGLMVTDISKEGFVKVDKCGGIDARVLQNALLTAPDGITGTVCCLPPHLSDGSEDKATPVSKVWVDFGMDAREIKKHLAVGDVLTFVSLPRMLLNDRVTSPALDNRCSAAALIQTAALLHEEEPPCKVVLLFSAQEETYGSGAVTGAYKINADEAIAVDVSFASQPDISGQYAKISLGEGPMIGISPILNKKMTKQLQTICEQNEMPYQLEPIAGRTGTNADKIALTRGGIKTAMISIPQRYMHTAVEVVDIKDVTATARLLADYVLSGGVCND